MLIGLQFIVQQTYTTVFKYIKKLKVNLKTTIFRYLYNRFIRFYDTIYYPARDFSSCAHLCL